MGFSQKSNGLGSVMKADNVSFDGTDQGGVLTTNGQLLVGSTATPHIKVGTLTSPDSSVAIGYSSPNITLSSGLGNGRFPITPYVVGPVGKAGYQTIQSALNAANSAGGGAVWVMPGSYTENLTLYPSSQIVGANSNSDAPLGSVVYLSGVHTPPITGFVSISNIFLSSATDIFNSAAAGNTVLVLENCTSNCTSGFTFNVPNWTGYLVKFNCQQGDVDNGVVNNTGGAPVFFESSNVGQGTGKTMVTSGAVHFNEIDLMCPWDCQTGTTLDLDTVTFSHTVTFSNNTTGTIRWGSWLTGASPAITMSSSAAISIFGGIIDSSNNPAVSGAGAGTLTYNDITFVNNASFAGTLTLATTSWQPYSRAIASTDATKVGTCAFNSAQFSVDANGFVSNISGGFTWTDVIGATQTLAAQNGYITDRGGGVTYTLPASGALGDIIKIVGKLGLATITPNANQQILIGSTSGAVGATGTAVSNNVGDCIELVCITAGASTVWRADSVIGTWTLTT